MWQEIKRFFSLSPQQATETRSADNPITNDGWRGWGELGYKSVSGPLVTRRTALAVPAVWNSVDLIAKTLASLPFGIFQRTSEEGVLPAKAHPLYHIIKLEPSPNLDYTTAYSFKCGLFAQACFGDAFAKIHRNKIGRATDLELLDSETVTMFQADDGSYYYLVRRMIGTRYVEEVIQQRDMLHVKGLTLNGVLGESVVGIHKDSIGTSISAEQYGNYFFANGANPSGAVIFPNSLTETQRTTVERKFKEKKSGLSKVGETLILDAGAKYEKMSLNPGEAMLNETRSFQVNQTSRVFGPPVPLLGQLDNATLNNVETLSTQFVMLCLRPWAVQVEQEFARKLLTYDERRSEVYFFRFNFAGLLRGDSKARAEYYKAALGGPSTGIGWMSVNEVRELENLDWVDDGDDVFTAEALMEMQMQSKANGTQTMAQPEADAADAEDDTNDNETGTPQASNGSD